MIQDEIYDGETAWRDGTTGGTIITEVPGTVKVKDYYDKTDAITFTTTSGGITYAGGLNNNSYLDFYINVKQEGSYTINLPLAAGNAQWNAESMVVKVNDIELTTLPITPSTDWEVFVNHSCKFNAGAAGTYKISFAAKGGAVNVADFNMARNGEIETPEPPTEEPVTEEPTTEEPTTEEPTTEEPTASTRARMEINGYQISTTFEGFRVVFSSIDPDKDVVSTGLVYGLADRTADNEMVVGSSNTSVHSYEIDEYGILNDNFSSDPSGKSFAMTMKNIKTAQFYNMQIGVRAFAKLKDGSYVYSGVKKLTVYNLANYLYQNQLMTNIYAHNYLYKRILTVVNPDYKEVDFDWNKTLIK